MPRVDMVHTTYSQQGLADSLESYASELPGVNAAAMAIMLAQIDLETANGQALFNNNVGNVTTTGDPNEWWQPDSGPASKLKFRSYPTLDDGMAGYVGFIKSRPKMLSAAISGDVGAYARAIKSEGYTPDIDPVAVAAQLYKIAAEKRKLFQRVPDGPVLRNSNASASSGSVAAIGALVLIVITGAMYLKHRKAKS